MAKINKARSVDATYLAVFYMSTDELHERLYAPYTLAGLVDGGRAEPVSDPALVRTSWLLAGGPGK